MLLKNKLLSSKKQKVATLISYTYASVLASRGQTDHGPPLAALFHVTGKRVWLGQCHRARHLDESAFRISPETRPASASHGSRARSRAASEH